MSDYCNYYNERGDRIGETRSWRSCFPTPAARLSMIGSGYRFFDDHCRLFHHRPFLWHVWDGRRRDGFHALVNYHRLAEADGEGRRLLESLAYSYLGDWIARQQDGVRRGEGGADDRLAAAHRTAETPRRRSWRASRLLTSSFAGSPSNTNPLAGSRTLTTEYASIFVVHGSGSARRQKRHGHSAVEAQCPLAERSRQRGSARRDEIPVVLAQWCVHWRAH